MKEKINEEIHKKILNLFYRTYLRSGEVIVDNRSLVIAKEAHVERWIVEFVLRQHIVKKEKELLERNRLSHCICIEPIRKEKARDNGDYCERCYKELKDK